MHEVNFGDGTEEVLVRCGEAGEPVKVVGFGEVSQLSKEKQDSIVKAYAEAFGCGTDKSDYQFVDWMEGDDEKYAEYLESFKN